MRFTRMLLLVLLLLTATMIAAQESDSDGDGIADSQDFCPQFPGTADLAGCTPETFPDRDRDTIGDPVDSCPGDAGTAANNGCPDGVIPDYDADGLPDAQDQCPREYGDGQNGCPPDADGDTVPDFIDACPTQAGGMSNLGCPEGVTPPDTDADTVPDLFDACPLAAGVVALSGCPDGDADGTVDTFDVCPDQAGDLELSGCVLTTTASLPALNPLTAGNAAAIREVARLIPGSGRLAVSGNRLAVRGADVVYLYDLTSAALTPTTLSGTGFPDYPISLSATGAYLALLDFPADFNTPPFVQISDGATGAAGAHIAAPPDASGAAGGISSFAFSPTDPTLLVIAPLSGSPEAVGVTVPAYDVASNQIRAQLPLPGGAVNVAFSRNGSRFALDTTEAGTMALTLFDAATLTQIGRITDGGRAAFRRDAAGLQRGWFAVGGGLSRWQPACVGRVRHADRAHECPRVQRRRDRVGGCLQPGRFADRGGGRRAVQRWLDGRRGVRDCAAECRDGRGSRALVSPRGLDPRSGVQRGGHAAHLRRRCTRPLLGRRLEAVVSTPAPHKRALARTRRSASVCGINSAQGQNCPTVNLRKRGKSFSPLL